MKVALAILCLTAYTVSALNRRKSIDEELVPTNRRFGIQGGKLIDIAKAPYTVSLVTNGNYVGTGVLIQKNWVLTAAIYSFSLNLNSSVRVGSNNGLQGGKLIQLSDIVVNPGYNMTWDDDLMLLNLSEPINISKKVKPISLASSLPKPGANTVVSAFGPTTYTFAVDGLLRQAVVPFIPYKTCKSYYEHKLPIITSKNFCASKSRVGACPAEWGAPLVYKNRLIGVFLGSVGDCGNLEYPGVYSDITKFKRWIKDTISH